MGYGPWGRSQTQPKPTHAHVKINLHTVWIKETTCLKSWKTIPS